MASTYAINGRLPPPSSIFERNRSKFIINIIVSRQSSPTSTIRPISTIFISYGSLLPLVLVTLTSRFEATRGLFWDGSRKFEPRSDVEDDT
ncbi:hypothetical protein AVEN_149314-1 [Araneus ventricosus]|uniref:Uncharacterized protein n=1 Tax=Araneus ventricosus TaxID=182803 RepID=A0A4Y2WW09_ARAVE|nr:hypothetical protein AVEN_149314-1 [Araneus ventricosus]